MGKSETENGSQRTSKGSGVGGKSPVIQNHHVSYDPEVVVRIRKCEHLVLTRLQWYCKKQVSRGLITALKVFIALNEDKAKEL